MRDHLQELYSVLLQEPTLTVTWYTVQNSLLTMLSTSLAERSEHETSECFEMNISCVLVAFVFEMLFSKVVGIIM